jgi:Tfp pilus assembly protein PilP
MLVERVKAGNIFGVGDGKIVGVDDEQFRVGGIAQSFGNALRLSRRDQRHCEENDCEYKVEDAHEMLHTCELSS